MLLIAPYLINNAEFKSYLFTVIFPVNTITRHSSVEVVFKIENFQRYLLKIFYRMYSKTVLNNNSFRRYELQFVYFLKY